MDKKLVLKLILGIACFSLMSCSEEHNSTNGGNLHDSKAWFSEKELSDKYLSNLPQPTGCTGEINSSTSWFNEGYSFSQVCESEDILNSNATTYLNYFQTNFAGKFGVAAPFALGKDVTCYNIVSKTDIVDYHDTNPSPLYKFYYVSDTTVDADGYLLDGSVFTFEIRYEFSTSDNCYLFKLFIEKANISHNGVFTYKYKLK